MEQVRGGRAPQVPVPPLSAAPFDMSREMRQQMRMVRHRAFERHQENAQWTKELLDSNKVRGDATIGDLESSPKELQVKLEAEKAVTDELQQELAQQKEAAQAAQLRIKEVLAKLHVADDATALKECVEMVDAEKKRLLSGKQRNMEIVRL